MTTNGTNEKHVFASPAWIEAVGGIIRDLAATRGKASDQFSLLERYTGVPFAIAPSGAVTWHARVIGRQADVGPGEIEDADAVISADYANALSVARLVYTPQVLAERAAARAPGGQGPERDPERTPDYLVEAHNRIAAITA